MWKIIRSEDKKRPQERESQFYVGNGKVGQRTILSEVGDAVTLPGTYRNGFSDTVPMYHAEWAHGFPETVERMVKVPEVGIFTLRLDGEVPTLAEIEGFRETLDMKNGVYERLYRVRRGDKVAQVTLKKLASFVHGNVIATHAEVVFDGRIEIEFLAETDVHHREKTNDPRIAETPNEVELIEIREDGPWVGLQFRTLPSGRALRTGMRISGTGEAVTSIRDSGVAKTITGQGQLKAECLSTISADEMDPPEGEIRAELEDLSFTELSFKQSAWLQTFWEHTKLVILGDEEAQLGVRYAMFSLLQSVGRCGNTNIAAKGLTGEGYGGHTFWDTEMYVLPALMQANPAIARGLLLYRYRMLPAARKRARELGHATGASYPWRTITGLECSGYYPAGTAQYHLNADIAHAFVQYYLATGDKEFFLKRSLEVIFETARIWMEIGNFEGDAFHIHDVTGPDEYTAIVSDNYFTNKMAQFNLKWAVKGFRIAMEHNREKALALQKKLGITEEELIEMHRAHAQMVIPYDEERGIHAQDSTFLTKPIWPFEEVSKEKAPLLLHYHPLTIYRHQVLKQPDAVLANALFASETDLETAVRDYEYYEPLTTHDSSLSASMHSVAAGAIGKKEEAMRHFYESLRLDLDNTHKNTVDGLHMANFGGALLAFSRGFGGYRVTEEGLSLAPVLPEGWKGYEFTLLHRGNRIQVSVGQKSIEITANDAVEIFLYGMPKRIENKARFPLRDPDEKAILFDLDGVLASTSEFHFAAWRALSKTIGIHLSNEFEPALRGVSRAESLHKILQSAGAEDRFTAEEKEALAEEKNATYKQMIESLTPADLLPGVSELLEDLRSLGVKTALVSASQNAPRLIQRLGIENAFDVVVDPEEVERGKPAPDLFLIAAEKLNVMPYHCLGVEDAPAGIESIRRAGMWIVGIGDKRELNEARHVYPTTEAATPYIMKWLEG